MTQRQPMKPQLKKAADKSVNDVLTGSAGDHDAESSAPRPRGRPRNRRRKTPISTSMYVDLVDRMEEYVTENNISITEFLELAVERQLKSPLQ
ncbi:hypothetical protein [Arthrobacter pigmenti]